MEKDVDPVLPVGALPLYPILLLLGIIVVVGNDGAGGRRCQRTMANW